MKTKHTALALAAATALSLTLFAGPASASVKVGTLGCHSDGSTGFIIGSSDKLVCEFTPASGGNPEVYSGTLNTFGLDVGVTGRTVMTWAVVMADGRAYEASGLAGTFIGASADASAIVGGGAKLLVGGSNDSYTLQPLSIQAQEGINAAIGVSKLTLESAVAVPAQKLPVAVPSEPVTPDGSVVRPD
ncbi:DUF992 domain-containing protein [Jiella sp. MQZ9-1]|uniref:DUF992 domain-containing protein n=1 Tax=Jiella flava TaxID=2816857 RepID=A0A939FST6_9HYPH|nr:DUF992 domain-containing protein [Jiella flava]MBO0661268.1 DUF992 domain-containing protein [Jiella flava]MCD2469913.1 DUF992 domain-containing protein [Jiella flava]